MNNRILTIVLILVLCLSFTACGDSDTSSATEKTVTSSDGNYQLTVPLDWEDVTSQSGGSSILSIQKNSVNYIALGSQQKEGELKAYTAIITDQIAKSLKTKGKIQLTEPEPFQAGEYQGYKATIKNEVDDAELCSNIYCIQVEGQYVQVNGVYVSSIQKDISKEYDEIVESLSLAK